MSLAGGLWAQNDDEALVRLANHLEAVRAEARGQRWLTGGLVLGTGVVTASAGISSALLTVQADGWGDASWRQAQIVNAAAWGLLYSGIGLAVLALPGDAETLPDRFDRMPVATEADRHLKRTAGETALGSLADGGRTGRLWSAGLWGLAGGSLLGLGSQMSYADPRNNPLLYLGGSCAAVALLNLILESTPEREKRAYTRR